MCAKFKISDSEKALFRDATQKVKPLTHNKSSPEPYRPVKTPSQNPEQHRYIFSETESLPLVSGGDYLEFAHPGIHYKTLRKLKAGEYNVEAILDLHGKTATEAEQYLGLFLLQCRQKDIRHALIIHGKGRPSVKPILKNKLNHWLRQCDEVLAFCSAKVKDGESGAVYVLLKNMKEGS